MATRLHSPKEIALAQLETALGLYFRGQDYYSVIVLAADADEILGKMLMEKGVESSLGSLKKAVSAIHLKMYGKPLNEREAVDRANRAKNAIKHGTDAIEFDAVEEARDMLGRAIDNYWLLEEWLTPAMERFEGEMISGSIPR